MILGDLNGWIGNRTRPDIIDAFGVAGENGNGRKLVEFCVERGLCVVTHILTQNLPKYVIMAKGQDDVEIKSIIYLVLVKRDMVRYVQDVRAVRGIGRGLSYHHFVLCSQIGRSMD